MLHKPVPPIPYDNSETPWMKHWKKTARENPHLKTYRDIQKKAYEEWIKLYYKKKKIN